VDFDWTLCSNDSFGKPNKEMVELVKELFKERYEIVIYTSRPNDGEFSWESKKFGGHIDVIRGPTSIEKWLKKHKLDSYIKHIYYDKPEAVMYVDDRAFRYDSVRLNIPCKGLHTDLLLESIKDESMRLLK